MYFLSYEKFLLPSTFLVVFHYQSRLLLLTVVSNLYLVACAYPSDSEANALTRQQILLSYKKKGILIQICSIIRLVKN